MLLMKFADNNFTVKAWGFTGHSELLHWSARPPEELRAICFVVKRMVKYILQSKPHLSLRSKQLKTCDWVYIVLEWDMSTVDENKSGRVSFIATKSFVSQCTGGSEVHGRWEQVGLFSMRSIWFDATWSLCNYSSRTVTIHERASKVTLVILGTFLRGLYAHDLRGTGNDCLFVFQHFYYLSGTKIGGKRPLFWIRTSILPIFWQQNSFLTSYVTSWGKENSWIQSFDCHNKSEMKKSQVKPLPKVFNCLAEKISWNSK